jgi:hypothetical protein
MPPEYNPASPFYGMSDSEIAATKAANAKSAATNARARERGNVNLPGHGRAADDLRRQQAAENEARDAAVPEKYGKQIISEPPRPGSHLWMGGSQRVLGGASPSAVSGAWQEKYQTALRAGARAHVGSLWGRNSPITADEEESIPSVASRVSKAQENPQVMAAAVAIADAAVPAGPIVRQQLAAAGIRPSEIPGGGPTNGYVWPSPPVAANGS